MYVYIFPIFLILSISIGQVIAAGQSGGKKPSEKSTEKTIRVEGYLLKWTNYATGYKRRYFVLEHGNPLCNCLFFMNFSLFFYIFCKVCFPTTRVTKIIHQ